MSFEEKYSELLDNHKLYLDNSDSILHFILSENSDEDANWYLKDALPVLDSEFINYQNKNSVTALLYACSKGYYECVKTLINNQADVNIQYKNEEVRFHAINLIFDKFPLEQQTELLNLFIEHGLCAYDLNNRGDSLLHLAAEKEKEIFEMAFNYQKNPDVFNKMGEKPLDKYFACHTDLEDLLFMLKNTQKHMYVTKHIKNTPCHYLSMTGNKPVLGYICTHFPEFNKPNAKKEKPRQTLSSHNH